MCRLHCHSCMAKHYFWMQQHSVIRLHEWKHCQLSTREPASEQGLLRPRRPATHCPQPMQNSVSAYSVHIWWVLNSSLTIVLVTITTTLKWIGTLFCIGTSPPWKQDRTQTVCRTLEAHVTWGPKSLAACYMERVSHSLTRERPLTLSITCPNQTRFALELYFWDPVSHGVFLHEVHKSSTVVCCLNSHLQW